MSNCPSNDRIFVNLPVYLWFEHLHLCSNQIKPCESPVISCDGISPIPLGLWLFPARCLAGWFAIRIEYMNLREYRVTTNLLAKRVVWWQQFLTSLCLLKSQYWLGIHVAIIEGKWKLKQMCFHWPWSCPSWITCIAYIACIACITFIACISCIASVTCITCIIGCWWIKYWGEKQLCSQENTLAPLHINEGGRKWWEAINLGFDLEFQHLYPKKKRYFF